MSGAGVGAGVRGEEFVAVAAAAQREGGGDRSDRKQARECGEEV